MHQNIINVVNRLNQFHHHDDESHSRLMFFYIGNGFTDAISFIHDIILWENENYPELVENEEQLYKHCINSLQSFIDDITDIKKRNYPIMTCKKVFI